VIPFELQVSETCTQTQHRDGMLLCLLSSAVVGGIGRPRVSFLFKELRDLVNKNVPNFLSTGWRDGCHEGYQVLPVFEFEDVDPVEDGSPLEVKIDLAANHREYGLHAYVP
jgi:hypothetical protein